MLLEISTKSKTVMPNTLAEARITGLTPNRLDILYMLFAEIGKDTDIDSNLDYTLTALKYAELKGYTDTHKAYETLRKKVWGNAKKHDTGIKNLGYEVYNQDGSMAEYVNFFQKVGYRDGATYMVLTTDLKKMLVETKNTNGKLIFASLQYLLPMRSTYAKRIYVMCKQYQKTGKRYSEKHNIELFRERLEIPTSYSMSMIKTKILDLAVKEINDTTDLEIKYTLETQPSKGRSGTAVTGITFEIKKNSKNQIIKKNKQDTEPTQAKVSDYEELLPNSLFSEIYELSGKKLSNADIKSIIEFGKQCKMQDDIIKDIVTYALNQQGVNNLVGYILTLIKKGYVSPKQTITKSNQFNNFQQRDYDDAFLADLERKQALKD